MWLPVLCGTASCPYGYYTFVQTICSNRLFLIWHSVYRHCVDRPTVSVCTALTTSRLKANPHFIGSSVGRLLQDFSFYFWWRLRFLHHCISWRYRRSVAKAHFMVWVDSWFGVFDINSGIVVATCRQSVLLVIFTVMLVCRVVFLYIYIVIEHQSCFNSSFKLIVSFFCPSTTENKKKNMRTNSNSLRL